MAPVQSELLKDLTPDEAAAVLALGRRIELASGAELFSLGSTADHLYIVERGRISLTLPMQVQGHDQDVLVEERLPGQTVGWSGLIPPYRFTLKATAPLETDVIALSRSALLEYFAIHPFVGYAITRNLAAVIGERLQIFQAMWLREMQRVVELRSA
ncbi:MAG: cyclic nucleotide-binding domain-containing protein [Acidobacteria bacterium]|nr:cyclic nucleotide-binding domain-containing protein [Acidobacteriota bacterium]